MSITAGNFMVVYESITMTPVNPEYLSISEDNTQEYIKSNPMPNDPEYSEEDMIGDITNSSGFYCLPRNAKKETINYVTDLLNALW